jgi:predicted Rossmann fold nucleotide-binding protein DprA/Smf involved in DNA uptake
VDFGVGDMRIGIVGSRRRTDRSMVEACIAELAPDTVVVTGGARGPDRWAVQAARARGLGVVVHEPDSVRRAHAGKQPSVITRAISSS